MAEIKFSVTESYDYQHPPAGLKVWRQRYSGLLESFGTLGTEVRRSRVLEQRDADTGEFRLISDAFHLFVFPTLALPGMDEGHSYEADNRPGLERYVEEVRRTFDSFAVEGALGVSYNEADGKFEFSVSERNESQTRFGWSGNKFADEVLEAVVNCSPLGSIALSPPI